MAKEYHQDFDWCGGISIRRPIIEEITYNDNIVGCLDNIWTSVYFVNHIRGIIDGLGTRIKIYRDTHSIFPGTLELIGQQFL